MTALVRSSCTLNTALLNCTKMSLSLIVRTAVRCAPSTAPAGLLNARFTVSSPSGRASSVMTTSNVWTATPTGNTSKPLVLP